MQQWIKLNIKTEILINIVVEKYQGAFFNKNILLSNNHDQSEFCRQYIILLSILVRI